MQFLVSFIETQPVLWALTFAISVFWKREEKDNEGMAAMPGIVGVVFPFMYLL